MKAMSNMLMFVSWNEGMTTMVYITSYVTRVINISCDDHSWTIWCVMWHEVSKPCWWYPWTWNSTIPFKGFLMIGVFHRSNQMVGIIRQCFCNGWVKTDHTKLILNDQSFLIIIHKRCDLWYQWHRTWCNWAHNPMIHITQTSSIYANNMRSNNCHKEQTKVGTSLYGFIKLNSTTSLKEWVERIRASALTNRP